jgi:murein DD-endopeptidase MepM/ murein hydrolase activator NlpD
VIGRLETPPTVPDMTTSRTYSSPRALAALASSFVLLVVLSLAIGSVAHAGSANEGCTGTYRWPVEPFDRPHQIRGAFGDPRTVFRGPPTRETLYTGSGKFLFHEGVDITAPHGQPVYPVASGTIVRLTSEMVGVDCGNGRGFEYWHIDPRVHVGQRVVAGKTLLGRIKRTESHVHLTELRRGYPVNPERAGALDPYEDTTTPRVLGIALRQSEGSADAMPQFIRGSVYLLAEAVDTAESIDTAGLRTPGLFRNWPVTPARIAWRIESWDGHVVVRDHVARDVRESLPDDSRFWDTFARGTYQGQSVFGPHYSYLQPGRYVFNLAGGRVDTRTLDDGVYDLVVTAEDIAGHRDVQSLRFTVHNAPGWAGKS